MFWKFDLHTSSHLEALLDKEDVTLTELMDEEDVLQECKAQNRRSLCWTCIHFILLQSYQSFLRKLTGVLSVSRLRVMIRLLQFLSQDQCMQELVRLITTEPPTGVEEVKRFK